MDGNKIVKYDLEDVGKSLKKIKKVDEMITEYDERVYVESEFMDEFKRCIHPALTYIQHHKEEYKEYDYGIKRMQTKMVANAFDKFIQDYGFELDGRSLKHAYGIGNNNNWDIVDKNLVKVGDFFCTNDMYGGVIVGVKIKGEIVESHKVR